MSRILCYADAVNSNHVLTAISLVDPTQFNQWWGGALIDTGAQMTIVSPWIWTLSGSPGHITGQVGISGLGSDPTVYRKVRLPVLGMGTAAGYEMFADVEVAVGPTIGQVMAIIGGDILRLCGAFLLDYGPPPWGETRAAAASAVSRAP